MQQLRTVVLAGAATNERRKSKRVAGSMEHGPKAPRAGQRVARVAAAQRFANELLVSGLGKQSLLVLACDINAVEVVHEGNPFKSAIGPRWMCASSVGVIRLTSRT
jgi:hypothetical protein